jgi:hypothetical protein
LEFRKWGLIIWGPCYFKVVSAASLVFCLRFFKGSRLNTCTFKGWDTFEDITDMQKLIGWLSLSLSLSLLISLPAWAAPPKNRAKIGNTVSLPIGAAPPWRAPCNDNDDCAGAWICVPAEQVTCSTTGLPCNTSKIGGDCDSETKDKECLPVNGYGRCLQDPWLLGDAWECQKDDDCPGWWNGREYVQICDKKKVVGRCVDTARKIGDQLPTGQHSFCNPEMAKELNNCKYRAGTCQRQSTCMPPNEAEAELKKREIIPNFIRNHP